MPEVCVKPVDPTTPAVTALLTALDTYQCALYPPESMHLLPATALAGPNTVFLGAYLGERLIGCGGCVNQAGEYGELKRMFVLPEARGLGVGRLLLESLEARAASAGLSLLRLETGIHQPEALRLYERAGYARRGPYGSYPDDPFSVYMEKRLDV